MMPFHAMRLRSGGAAPPPAFSTWDPATKGANISLSGGNLIATTSNFGSVRGTQGRSASGVYQFEVTGTAGGQAGCGISTVSPSGGFGQSPGFNTGMHSYMQWGDKYDQGTPSAYGASWGADVIGVVVDFGAGTLKYYKNGSLQGTAATGLSGTWYPLAGTNSGSYTLTLNVGASAFAYPIGGATAWG